MPPARIPSRHSWIWNAIASGARGVVFWQWRPELLGPDLQPIRRLSDGALVGHNTDVAGFTELVASVLGIVPAGAHFAVIGAGGAAAAVLAAIEKWERCSATLYSRTESRAANLAQRFSGVASSKSMMHEKKLAGDIVVNATPVGLNDDELPVPLSALPPRAIVLDLVCKAGETAWVRAARSSGHVASDGFPMLVGQGAAAFEIWFGAQPDREAMWRGLRLQT